MAYHGVRTYMPYPANPCAATNARPSHDTTATSSNSSPSTNGSNSDQSARSSAVSSPPTTTCDDDATAELAIPTDALEDETCGELEDDGMHSPLKGHEGLPLCASTPAHDTEHDLDESYFESPVKAHLLVRPGAPTPGRGRTQYLSGSDSDEDDRLYVVVEDSVIDDVFGSSKQSLTWDDSYDKFPSLDRASLIPSTNAKALDLALEYDTPKITCNMQTNLDWLHLDSRDDIDEIIISYLQLSRPGMHEYLQEAIEEVESLIVPSASAPQFSAMDINLDDFFGGQGATDLAEDDFQTETVPYNSEEEKKIVAMSQASDLLALRAQGLPLSEFIPTGQQAYNTLLAVFHRKTLEGFEYNLEGAKIAAADVAYFHLSQGLDTLKRNGIVTRQYPSASKRMPDWTEREHDSAILLPYDPQCCKMKMLRYTIAKPKQSTVSCVDPAWRHFNFFGHTVDLRSITPATVSLFVQLLAHDKPWREELSRVGVLLSQANKYIDPVVYDGPEELLSLHGTAFKDQTTGYVSKLNSREGFFGDLFDGETIIKGYLDICDYFLANRYHNDMQRPCIMDYEEQAYKGDRDSVISAPAPREFFRKRDAQGKIVHWNLPGLKKPATICSKLWVARSVDDEDFDGPPWPLREVRALLEAPHKPSEIVEEEPVICDSDVEEYSPLNPTIPGMQRTYEEWEPEEMSEEEVDRQFAALIKQAAAGQDNEAQPQSGDSSSVQDSDEGTNSLSWATTPPPPIVSESKPSSSNVYDSALSFSKISVINDTPPCAPTTTTESTESDETEGLSKYAFAYGAFMIGIGIGAATLRLF